MLALCLISTPRTKSKTQTAYTQPKTVQVSINSEAALLITDGEGKRLGFDTEKQTVVNEIAGASVNYETRFPVYLLPSDNSSKPYTILISGKSLKSKVETNLTLTGPGFLVGFKGIHLNALENLNATVSLDGKQLSFTAGQSSETPTLSYAVSAGHGKPSYKFEVSTLKLSQGKLVATTLDLFAGRLFFKDDDEKRNKYSVMIRRTNPDGTRSVYQRRDISFGASDNYVIEYGKWDGRGAICFKVYGGKAFDQSACVEMPNEAAPVP
ncbi:MAG: hypothetical protein DMF68_20970 [Acidobacteria bacterium]|nr:MAG: hypothetical protein DMF68_20970 [Acidobacteriota bacterium]